MKRNAAMVVGLFALLASAPGFAQFHLGAGTGRPDVRLSASPAAAGLSIYNLNYRDTGTRLFGGYELRNTWGLEIRYADLGKFRYDFKLGLSHNRAIDAVTGNATFVAAANLAQAPLTGSTSKTRVMGGLGLQYDLSRSFGFRLEYENFGRFGDDNLTDRSRFDLWSGKLLFRF